MFQKIKTYIKKGLIFIISGFILNYLWDYARPPIIYFFFNFMPEQFNNLLFYKLHSGYSSYYQLMSFGVFLLLFILMYIIIRIVVINLNAIHKSLHENSQSITRIKILLLAFKKEKIRTYVLFFLCICIMIFLYSFLNFRYYVAEKTLVNLEIIAPYITDSEYKNFKSRYYLINTQSDYEILKNDLDAIAYMNSINLE